MDENRIQSEIDQLKGDRGYRSIQRTARASKIVSLLIVPLVFVVVMYGTIRLNDLNKETTSLMKTNKDETLRRDSLKKEITQLDEKKKQLEQELVSAYAVTSGDSAEEGTDVGIEARLTANEAIRQIAPAREVDGKVVIRYYNKTVDQRKITLQLQEMGYQFEEKEPTLQMSRSKTNAIWFGSGVPIKDLKVVALTLMRAGVQIKGIRPYRNEGNFNQGKRYVIEIGSSSDLDNKKPLTVDQVRNAKAFVRSE